MSFNLAFLSILLLTVALHVSDCIYDASHTDDTEVFKTTISNMIHLALQG